jgi:formylglycine-generating enzyme required for sulfatase activity
VALKGGSFTMGGGERREENPAHRVTLSPFRIDPYEVTVARFASFVKRTNHVTDAETYGWSGVFDVRAGEWTKRDGATWRRPAGPRSPTAEENTPVVHVSHRDAMAFCRAEAGRLPTEAEWEYAARGGYEGRVFPWGNEPSVGGRHQANWWQGVFPGAPKVEDGFAGVAPVGRFRPNGYGLYDMVGNVWEWSADWYARDAYSRSPVKDPRGPASGTEKVIRGGSWMCSLNYCRNFRNAARSMTAPDSGLDNLGFRCAYD